MKIVTGAGLIALGGIMVFGGITGRLAPMVAALFVPSALTDREGGHGESFWHKLGDAITPGFDVPGIPII